jgi:hypothetical protein
MRIVTVSQSRTLNDGSLAYFRDICGEKPLMPFFLHGYTRMDADNGPITNSVASIVIALAEHPVKEGGLPSSIYLSEGCYSLNINKLAWSDPDALV